MCSIDTDIIYQRCRRFQVTSSGGYLDKFILVQPMLSQKNSETWPFNNNYSMTKMNRITGIVEYNHSKLHKPSHFRHESGWIVRNLSPNSLSFELNYCNKHPLMIVLLIYNKSYEGTPPTKKWISPFMNSLAAGYHQKSPNISGT